MGLSVPAPQPQLRASRARSPVRRSGNGSGSGSRHRERSRDSRRGRWLFAGALSDSDTDEEAAVSTPAPAPAPVPMPVPETKTAPATPAAPAVSDTLFTLPVRLIPTTFLLATQRIAKRLHLLVHGSFVSDARLAFSVKQGDTAYLTWRCEISALSVYDLERDIFGSCPDIVVIDWHMKDSLMHVAFCLVSDGKDHPACARLVSHKDWSVRAEEGVNKRDLSDNYQEQALPYVRKKCNELRQTLHAKQKDEVAWFIAHLATQMYQMVGAEYKVFLESPADGRLYITCGGLKAFRPQDLLRLCQGLVRVEPLLVPDTMSVRMRLVHI